MAGEQETIRGHVKEVARIAATLDEESGTRANRRKRFKRLQQRLASSGDATRMKMAVVMAAFVVGLFVGPEAVQALKDDLDLERWFRLPKGHERRINGRRHAGVRLVQEGATLMPVLDAHREGAGFTAEQLLGFRDAEPPPDEQEAIKRRKVMRKARSKKKPCPARFAGTAVPQQRLAFNRAVGFFRERCCSHALAAMRRTRARTLNSVSPARSPPTPTKPASTPAKKATARLKANPC